MSAYPQMFRVRQTFEAPRVDDIPATVESELSQLTLQKKIRPGQSVAITCGSRGIANIHTIIKAIVQHVQGLGAKPFVVPAMGSHGGGTVEGQRAILTGYGVTEEFLGCPVRATMETVVICNTEEGFPVHFDRYAYEADHVIVCGRVKPHTNFVGDIESGLMKMMLIGLGKHNGAKIYHRAIHNYRFGQIVRSVGARVLEKCRVVAGVGIVENGYDQTALIAAVGPEEFEQRERELLVLAKQWMPRLPFDQVDILFVEEIGKNISGTGMDTNVIGRKYELASAGIKQAPTVTRIIVRGLTEATHGNATGIGNSEFCLARCVRQMDAEITKINCLTGGHPGGAKIPMYYESDRECLDAALSTIGLIEPPDARIMWIHNTLDLAEVECSAPYLADARERTDLEVLTDLYDLPLDAGGNLPKFRRSAAGEHVSALAH
jgi:hypothetical protein